MCSFNVTHGPLQDEQKYASLGAVVKHLKESYGHGNLPALFLAAAPRILHVLRLAGIDLPGELDPEFEAWDWMLDNWNASRGAKVIAGRFQGSVATAEKNVLFWHLDRCIRTLTYVCMQVSMCLL